MEFILKPKFFYLLNWDLVYNNPTLGNGRGKYNVPNLFLCILWWVQN